jgi:RNA polymerase sigma factor (sigma-70 family)
MRTLADYLRSCRVNLGAVPDGELLGRFLGSRDREAFAALVRRHGPLVWGACRRLLPDPADAEDAFQATFLVLVRRAPRLAGRAELGPWLYRVAAWTARNVRRHNARRLARRRPLPDALPGRTPDPGLRADVDAALMALPEKYRAPVVLCHLQGRSRREAAALLGCPEGTLSSLLARAAVKLRRRLRGHDPAAAVALAAAAVLPAGFARAAARAAAAYLNFPGAGPAVAPPVAALTQGVLRMFWMKKCLTAAALAAAVGVTALGLGAGRGPAARAQAQPAPAKGQAPAAGPDDDILARLKQLEADQAQLEGRLKQLQAQRQELDTLAKERAAARARAAKKEAYLKITVGAGNDWNPSLFLDEYGKDGESVGSFRCPEPQGLLVYLRRAYADKDGPRRVELNIDPNTPHERAKAILDACRAAGFRKIYTSAASPALPFQQAGTIWQDVPVAPDPKAGKK